jgi:hypothetical protein
LTGFALERGVVGVGLAGGGMTATGHGAVF